MKTRKNLFMMSSYVFLFLLGLFCFGASTLFAENPDKVKPLEFVIEPPTLISLGFEWYIEGDDNHNSIVEVWYRKKGDTSWKQGLPLLRLDRERVTRTLFYQIPNMFAGSILDLEPGTEYECKFIMSDPDGVRGEAHKNVTVRTRAEPKPFEGGRTLHVYPPGYTGPKINPAFTGLNNAYSVVEPGDIILIHAGLYKEGNRYRYGGTSGLGLGFHGTYFLTKSGTPEKPIAIKAAGDGEVIFDGNGCYNLFNVMAANYNYFEGLTIRNTDIAFQAGLKFILGCSGLVVKRCRFENIGIGITTLDYRSKDFYVADNVFIGREDPTRLMGWIGHTWEKLPGFPEGIQSYYAVGVQGQGHVVCHNYITGFHDGIDIDVGDPYTPTEMEYVVAQNLQPVAIDFYNNDVSHVSDNCVETDPGFYNIRVLRNRCINSAHRPLSSQVNLGGPVYFIRNIVYHAPEGGSIKFYYRTSGMIVYHNTLCAEVAIHLMDYGVDPSSNMHFRNNLILGQGAWKEIFFMDTYTNYTTSDYNGYRPNEGAEFSFVWTSPPFDILADYVNPRVVRNFKTLTEFSQATGQDEHSILVDYDIFLNVAKADPSDPTRIYKVENLDFRLKPNAVAVDAGCILPNVNDDFTGQAPDLGALEVGRPMPIYGPRPLLP